MHLFGRDAINVLALLCSWRKLDAVKITSVKMVCEGVAV